MPLGSRPQASASEGLVPVVEPYRLDLTAAVLRRLSTNVVDRSLPDGRYVRALAGVTGPVVVVVRQREPGALHVTVAGTPGEEPRALALVRRMLGVERDMAAFDRAARRVPWLRALARRMRGVKPPRYPTLWEATVNAVVFQQISLEAAGAIMRRLVEAFGAKDGYEGIALNAFPEPAAILAASEASLRATGLSAGKTATLRRIAEALTGGVLDEAMLEERASPDAARLLCEIKGIGPWTAAVVLLRGLGRLDVFPANDSGIARSAAAIAGGTPIDLPAALETLGDQRGMLYYHFLLARLEARGELGPVP
jgi:DNA-3-methyladenine glycosylase II